MSEKITSTFYFYGNQAIVDLEKEIIRRFKEDYDQGNDKYTSVSRILYGLDQETQYNGYELLGAYQCQYFGSTHKFEVMTATCPPLKLHDYIVENLAKIDPKVVVQMDYIGNTPNLVGTRFAGIDEYGDLISTESKEELDYWFCDESDIEDLLEDIKERGQDERNVMSYQRLDEITEEMRQYAFDDFTSSAECDIELKQKSSERL